MAKKLARNRWRFLRQDHEILEHLNWETYQLSEHSEPSLLFGLEQKRQVNPELSWIFIESALSLEGTFLV